MKKYLLSTLAVAGLMVAATNASASWSGFEAPTYAVVEAGYSMGQKDNDDSALLGLGMGYQFDKYMRADIIADYRGWGEVKFKGDKHHKTDVWSIPVLANAYVTYPFADGIGIYGMGGIGMAFTKTDKTHETKGKMKTNFAWNVGAGVEYKLTPCLVMDLGYRYSDLGQARIKYRDGFSGKSKADMRSHDIKLGLRYYF